MWRRTIVALGCAGQLGAVLAAGGHAHCLIEEPSSRYTVQLAIDGAVRRLGSADCQRVLDDFTDTSGLLLRSVLEGAQTSPITFFENLRFADGALTPQCIKRDSLAAYTAPGITVIFVCGQRFGRLVRHDPKTAEIIIIHEMLHAVGLGEDPPSSEDITRQVRRRCGSV